MRIGDLPPPEFSTVGAPRGGTTAPHRCLRDHPDVFMPENKERHLYGSDLRRQPSPMSRAEYGSLVETLIGRAQTTSRATAHA